jgi:BMFP domain-containing protein YqiC
MAYGAEGTATHSCGAQQTQPCVNRVLGDEAMARQQVERLDGEAADGEAATRRVEMSFMNSNGLDDLAKRLADSVPESLRTFGRDLESNFKAVLQAQLAKLDLVTRQDFDVQAAILERTQAKLTAIEIRLKDLESKLP